MRRRGLEPRSHRWQRQILTTKLPTQIEDCFLRISKILFGISLRVNEFIYLKKFAGHILPS